MKTHTIKTPTAELLIVELPRKADVEIFPNSIEIYNQFTGQEETIKGHYTLLGKPDEIREEDAGELVELFSIQSGRFKDYLRPECGYKTATESLLSLLESEIFWNVNPYEKPETCFVERFQTPSKSYEEFYLEWHEAEQKTFNRNRSIIFKKVTPKI